MALQELRQLESKLTGHFSKLRHTQDAIKNILIPFADHKTLKGNELVGWLGEIYGKILLEGTLISDRYEHDFETADGKRVSVKTRKGNQVGWRRTSAIPKIKGPDCPTHLMFVHLQHDFSLADIWLYPWTNLIKANRFQSHTVRGIHRSYIFHVNTRADEAYRCFPSSSSTISCQ